MTTFQENPENATKCPESYETKLALDKVMKKMTKANNCKAEVQQNYFEMNKFLCINIDIPMENVDKVIIIFRKTLTPRYKTRKGINIKES